MDTSTTPRTAGVSRAAEHGATPGDLPTAMPGTSSPTPERIMQLGFGFWGAKTLLSAVELGLFSELARGPLEAETLRVRLGLHPRGACDFFDALVALGMLERTKGRYHNTPETALFLDRGNRPISAGCSRCSMRGCTAPGDR